MNPQPSCGSVRGETGPQQLTGTWFCQEDSHRAITANDGSWAITPPACGREPWICALGYVDVILKIVGEQRTRSVVLLACSYFLSRSKIIPFGY